MPVHWLPPKRPSESDEEFEEREKAYRAAVRKDEHSLMEIRKAIDAMVGKREDE